MAIGYTLLGKPVEGIDTSSLNELSDTLLLQEKNREIQRQTWREEQDALRQTQRDLKPSANQDANQFFGRFSGGIMDESLDLQNMLETGQIKSSEYSARWRNLNQTNEQMIAAQKGYQEKAQKITEAVNNGTASVVDAEALNEFNIRFQPGAMEVERDGRGGLRLFNKETGTEVSPSYLSDLVNSSLPKFDYTAAATKLVDSFGKRGILKSSGYSIEGVYANVPTEELDNIMQKEAEAILSGAQAPTVSILTDGMKYGVVYNREELVEGKNIYRKSDGTFEFAGKDQEAAVNFMATQLENALPKSIKEKQTKDDTSYDKSVSKQDKDAELSYELAYDITLGGPKQANNKQIILANNDTLKDLNETKDTWVIEYKDEREDKIIQKIKKTVNGEETYDREATAEALYTIVDPNSTPVKSQKARQNYFKTRDIKQPVSTDLLQSTRQPTPASNTTNYYTNQEISKGITKAVPISAQIESITDLDEDSAPELESIIRGIQTLSGTDNFFDPITVKRSPAKTAFAEVVRVTLPENIAALLKDKSFVRSTGSDYVDVTVEGGPGGISEEEGKSNVNQLVDALIAEMTNKHNSSKGVKKKTRSISQIMKEDGVSPSEAQKIFNAQ
jgi:hypothetical protein